MIANISRYRLSILIPLFFLILLPSYSIEEPKDSLVRDYLSAIQYVDVGVKIGRLGEYDMAKFAFQQAIEKYPNYDIAHYGLGLALMALNNKDAALAEFEILMSINHKLAGQLYYIIYPPGGIELLLG